MIEAIRAIDLALRAVMELGIVVALGDWGYHLADARAASVLLMVAAPLVGFGFWGLVDFRRAGRLAEALRLTQELVISGLAAWAWYATGRHTLGWALAALSVLHHATVYATGRRLLKEEQGAA